MHHSIIQYPQLKCLWSLHPASSITPPRGRVPVLIFPLHRDSPALENYNTRASNELNFHKNPSPLRVDLCIFLPWKSSRSKNVVLNNIRVRLKESEIFSYLYYIYLRYIRYNTSDRDSEGTAFELAWLKGNTLLKICTPNIRISRIWAEYQNIGYHPDIIGMINGFQEKNYQIWIKYPSDFSRVFKT